VTRAGPDVGRGPHATVGDAPPLLLRDVEVSGERVDVRVEGGIVGAVDRRGDGDARGARIVDGGGGALLPGLHDHHVHLLATAAAAGSVAVGPADVAGTDALAATLGGTAAATEPGGWVRAVGYHESVAGDLDRWALDRLLGEAHDVAVRLQHRSGALWVLNGAALDRIGDLPDAPGIERTPDGTPTGRFFRAEAWLPRRWPPVPVDLAAVGHGLLGLGVTGVTDATPYEEAAPIQRLAAAAAAGELPQHLVVMGGPALAAAGGGLPQDVHPGPVKVVLADSGLPDLATVTRWVARAHGQGRPVAIHCVTADALVVALAALADAGPWPGDRLEHAAVVPAALLPDVVALGVTVVTQPAFVATRGDDYRRDVEPGEQEGLWRCGSLLRAGVPLGAGSDSPYGDLDPWRAVAAAVDRRTASGEVLGADERVAAREALDLWLGPPGAPGGPARRVRPGVPADLCLLDAPLAKALAAPTAGAVRAAFVAGSDPSEG
jgi:predicted amidohydrolase YtcJ